MYILLRTRLPNLPGYRRLALYRVSSDVIGDFTGVTMGNEIGRYANQPRLKPIGDPLSVSGNQGVIGTKGQEGAGGMRGVATPVPHDVPTGSPFCWPREGIYSNTQTYPYSYVLGRSPTRGYPRFYSRIFAELGRNIT